MIASVNINAFGNFGDTFIKEEVIRHSSYTSILDEDDLDCSYTTEPSIVLIT